MIKYQSCNFLSECGLRVELNISDIMDSVREKQYLEKLQPSTLLQSVHIKTTNETVSEGRASQVKIIMPGGIFHVDGWPKS